MASCLEDFESLESCERLSGGASQATYRIRARTSRGIRQLAMRRAIGSTTALQPGRPGMRAEAAIIQHAREAGVPEPVILHVLEPGDGLGEGFLMEWIDGETLGARIVRSEELAEIRPRLARQCGEILARIHSIDLETTGLARTLERVSPEAFIDQTWAQYRAFETPQPMIDYTARWLKEHLPANSARTLVHNDFRNGNLIVSPRGVEAVLDWELAHVGDPMRDLGWICTGSWRFGRNDLPVGGFGLREDLFAGYESVSGRSIDPERVRFWEVFGSFWWAVGCLTMAAIHRAGQDPSVERAAIGRRSSECQVDCVNLLFPGPVSRVSGTGNPRSTEMPRTDELVASVRDFLRADLMEATSGRARFLARVAANSLDIVLRDLEVGGPHRERERERLESLLGSRGDLETLRWALVEKLRDGSMALAEPGLQEHLRETVVNQLAIDQPKYAGLKAVPSS